MGTNAACSGSWPASSSSLGAATRSGRSCVDPRSTATPSGSAASAIGLSGALSVLIAFYLARIHKRQGGELPEDRLDANIDDGDAEQGHFSPWSWWPSCWLPRPR